MSYHMHTRTWRECVGVSGELRRRDSHGAAVHRDEMCISPGGSLTSTLSVFGGQGSASEIAPSAAL
jgi:hypothetical protein